MTRLTTCMDAEAASRRAAAEIARRLEAARRERGVAHVALSGGTTPGRTYELLADELAGWDGIEVWFADERCVGPEDDQSNYKLAQETLLSKAAGISAERVHRMEGELGPDEGARRYADSLRAHVAPPGSIGADAAVSQRAGRPKTARPADVPALDVIVLGIGPDGHVASLFPGAAALDADQQAVCLGVWDAPKPPPQRITLSLAVLRAARRCLLLATGASKADAVAMMLAQPSRQVPASLLRRDRLTVIADDDASPSPAQE